MGEKESNTVKGARLLNLRHPRIRLKSYQTRTSLVRYDLNLILRCHRFYYLGVRPYVSRRFFQIRDYVQNLIFSSITFTWGFLS